MYYNKFNLKSIYQCWLKIFLKVFFNQFLVCCRIFGLNVLLNFLSSSSFVITRSKYKSKLFFALNRGENCKMLCY